MRNVYTLVILVLAGLMSLQGQTMTSYDLNPGTPGTTPVPEEAEWDPVANEPLLKFKAGSYYVEAKVSELEAFRTGTLALADFFINHSIKMNSTTTGQPLQLFRRVLNFSNTKGLLIAQANTTTAKNYLYKTDGKGMLTTNPAAQLTLDDLDLLDSVGYVRGHVNFKDKIVVSAGTPTYGIELMVIDSNYNMSIIDINTAASADATPQGLFVWGDSVIFFQATDGTNGVELWRSNGTLAGTMLVKDINTGGASNPEQFYAHGGKVYFRADDGTGSELWVTDGTNAGTVKVADLNSSAAAVPANLTSGPGGMLYFAATGNSGNRGLYKTDGTSAGTTLLSTDVAPSAYSFPYEFLNGELIFAGYPVGNDSINHLYKTDGTTAGTVLLYEVFTSTNPQYYGYGVSTSFTMATSGGYVYFTGHDSIHDYEIYRTNGTTAGTLRVTDFAQASTGSNYPNYLTPIPGGGVFFFGRDTIIGSELRILDLGMSVGISAPEVNMVGMVYPNPTMGVLNVEVPVGQYSLNLMDITGKLVASQQVEAANGTLLFNRSANAVRAGVYFLNIQNQDGLSQTVKVVYH